MAREMALENRARLRNLGVRLEGAGVEIELDDPVDQLKVFEPHGG